MHLISLGDAPIGQAFGRCHAKSEETYAANEMALVFALHCEPAMYTLQPARLVDIIVNWLAVPGTNATFQIPARIKFQLNNQCGDLHCGIARHRLQN